MHLLCSQNNVDTGWNYNLEVRVLGSPYWPLFSFSENKAGFLAVTLFNPEFLQSDFSPSQTHILLFLLLIAHTQ
jgi:hypothetical protein